jgi:hypothetical protein
MIMMFGDQASMLERRSPEWVKEMIQFMQNLGQELGEAGELVSAEGLVDATQAKKVDYRGGAVTVTDGPFAESKESLAGYWIVDVEGEPRVLEIASKIVDFIRGPVEVRQIGEAPPEV